MNKRLQCIGTSKKLQKKMGMPAHLREEILAQSKIINRRNNISLRDANKIMSHLMIAPDEASSENNLSGWFMIFVTLAITKVVSPDMYEKLCELRFTEIELSNFLDASNSRIQHDGMNTNRDFDTHTDYLYNFWIFVLRGGQLLKDEEARVYAQLFGRGLHATDIKAIPQKIHKKWLSMYQI